MKEQVEKLLQDVKEERDDKMSNFMDTWLERGKQEALKEGHLDI